MSTEIMTAVVFGYNLILTEYQQESLEGQGLTVFPVGANKQGNFYLVGYNILSTSTIQAIAEVELGSIDFSKYEANLQEIMKLMNIEIDNRPKLLLSNYYY